MTGLLQSLLPELVYAYSRGPDLLDDSLCGQVTAHFAKQLPCQTIHFVRHPTDIAADFKLSSDFKAMLQHDELCGNMLSDYLAATAVAPDGMYTWAAVQKFLQHLGKEVSLATLRSSLSSSRPLATLSPRTARACLPSTTFSLQGKGRVLQTL
mmetsp:Transcript_9992/g.17915  ORF Transcript_9992/g.17915 Transcript_9992/m.17915 type:complete len:153 (-) Transcript_9992:32-490(-)